jgi:hypothetical protein
LWKVVIGTTLWGLDVRHHAGGVDYQECTIDRSGISPPGRACFNCAEFSRERCVVSKAHFDHPLSGWMH